MVNSANATADPRSMLQQLLIGSAWFRASGSILWLSGLLFTLAVNGALPFLVAPAAAQAVWTIGFSESLANGPIWGIRAHDIGVPHPASIAFGLAGAWPASIFLRLGLPPADAYTLMVTCWLTVAFTAAFRLSRALGTSTRIATLAATTWLCTPIVWSHAHYSQLGLGIALLPLYFLPTITAISSPIGGARSAARLSLAFVAVSILAVFMDGYTFMMLAVGSVILTGYVAARERSRRAELLRVVAPAQAVGLGLAYALYAAYIGRGAFEAHSIDIFRAFGVDLAHLLIPTERMHWLADLVGLSDNRPIETQYGDFSVFTTTFALPMLVAGIAAWWTGRKHNLALAFAMVAMAGLYLSLGPSLKVFTTVPTGLPTFPMPAGEALGPTGSALLSQNLPGFDSMRASYRWLALCLFGLWLLLVLVCRTSAGRCRIWATVLAVVIAVNLPNVPNKLELERSYRESTQRIGSELVPDLKHLLRVGETAAFLPYSNDFVVNLAAPAAGIKALNIGGDKNLAVAREYWPPEMLPLTRQLTLADAPKIGALLRSGAVDVVVLPYFPLPWSPSNWPCGAVRHLVTSASMLPPPGAERACLETNRLALEPLLANLRNNTDYLLQGSPLLATVRLAE